MVAFIRRNMAEPVSSMLGRPRLSTKCQCLPSLNLANAEIPSAFFVKAQVECGILIMTPAVYMGAV